MNYKLRTMAEIFLGTTLIYFYIVGPRMVFFWIGDFTDLLVSMVYGGMAAVGYLLVDAVVSISLKLKRRGKNV